MGKSKVFLSFVFGVFFCLGTGLCMAESVSEKEDFQSLCKLYQKTPGTTGALSQAETFLKKHKRSDYEDRVEYIIASCLGDSDEAIKKFYKLSKRTKNTNLSISAQVMIAQIYYNLGRYKEAVEYYKKVESEYPTHFLIREVLFGLMQSQIEMGEWKDAESTLKKLLQADPYYEKQDKVIYSYGIILYHKKNYDEAFEKFSQLDSAAAMFYKGRCQEKTQKFIPATVTFKELLSRYPKNPLLQDTRFLIADCFFRSGDYEVAMDELNKFIEDFRDSYLQENALYRIACCIYMQKEHKEAVVKFREFVEGNRKSQFAPYASYMIGESFLAQNDLVRASFAYGEVLKSFPDSKIMPEVYYKLGWCYTQQNSYESAIDMFNRLILEYPKNPLVPYALLLTAENYSKKGSLDQAIECYRKVLDLPDKNEEMTEVALYMMTKTFYDDKRYNEIISSFQYILNSLPPSNSEWRSYTYLLVGEAYYAMGFYTEADRAYDMVIKNFPYTKVASMAQEGKAWTAFKMKDFSKAQKEREEFTEDLTVTKGKSTEISNEFEMGNIYYNQKKYVEALDAFEKFMQSYPDNELFPEALFNSGRCYYKLEYYTKAIQTWETLVNTFPKHARTQEAMNLIADTYFRAQKYAEAIEAYKRIIALYPGTDIAKQAQLRIGQSYYNAMDDESAILEFEKFINIYPDDSMAESALESLVMSAYRMGEAGTASDLDIKVLQDFVKKYPKSKLAGNAQFRLGMRFYEKKDFTRAAEELKNVANYYVSGQNAPDSYFYAAEAYYYSENYKEAIPIYQRFIKNFPKHEQIRIAYLHLANSLYYAEQYLEAAQVYQDLTRLTKDKDEVSSTAFLNNALCLKKASKWQDAVNVYERYLEEYPNSSNYNNTLIELFSLYEILKQYDNAIAVAEELLEKIPKDDPLRPELMFKMGELDLKQGNTEMGIAQLLNLISYRPLNDPWRLSALARAAQEYESAKRWSDAVNLYKEIVNSGAEQKWIAAAQERIRVISQQGD